jgi:hypothetical protein
LRHAWTARRFSLAAAASVAVVAAMFGLGLWSFGDMRVNQGPGKVINQIQPGPGGVNPRSGSAPVR